MNKKIFNSTLDKPEYGLFAIMLIFPLITLFFNVWAAVVQFLIAIVFTVVRLITKRRHSDKLFNYLQSITLYLDEASKENLTRFPMPVTLLDKKGDIIWYNDLFHAILESNHVSDVFGKNLDIIAPHVTINKDALSQKHEIQFLDKHYTLFIMHQGGGEQEDFYSVYWIDTTDMKSELSKLRAQRLCVAYILVDSFDELPASISELQKSIFLTRVDVKLRTFAKSIDGVMQKPDQDKYLILFEYKHLQMLEKSKFKLLAEIKEIAVEGFHASLSIGVGCGNGSPSDADTKAKKAIDTALSRGGDQAVILNGEKYSFFGGNSDSGQRRRRVKVRIIAEALTANVQSADNVIIMGHKFIDLDCLGSAIGIAKCVQAFGKTPYIIYNPRESLSKNMYSVFSNQPGYENMFVEPAAVPRLITDNSLLIITDTHNHEYIESEKIYSMFKKVIVIDHHRKVVQNAIEDTVVSFHEPNSSSCCEMVSELCENVAHLKLTRQEANALMSGIFLDTKMFTERTGARTFEAAAFLKKQGADTAEVKAYFKNDIESYKKQIDIISQAEVVCEKYAVSYWDFETFDGIKLIAAKAADEMLNLNGIEASFVIYPENEDVHFSARSGAGVNVQRIMEKLGGGGHRNAAGAQLKNTDIETAYNMLVDILNNPEREEDK